MSETASGKKKKMSIMTKILFGFILGIVVGAIFREKILFLEPFGTLFIRLLRMVVVPLVFASLVVGISSIEDIRVMGRVGIRVLILVLVTTAVSTTIGLFLALTLKPGVGVPLEFAMTATPAAEQQAHSFLDTLVEMVPINPLEAMVTNNMLQIIVFSVFLGVAMVMLGEKAKPLNEVLNSLADAMYKITNIIIQFAPIGVFALIAGVIGRQGIDALIPMMKLVGTEYLGCLLTLILVTGLFLIRFLGKLSPMKFFKAYAPAMVFSYVTGSSAATLPISMECTEQKMGVSKRIASFVQPLGATVNMNGSSLYQGICAVFVAQLVGVDMSLAQLLSVVFIAVVAAIGTAGVNGAGLVMLTLTLTSVGLPVEAIALVAGVDRLLEAGRCVPNVAGDAAMAVVIAKWEGELDEDIYNGKKQYAAETVL